jgi:hypothetical protein
MPSGNTDMRPPASYLEWVLIMLSGNFQDGSQREDEFFRHYIFLRRSRKT